VVLDELFCDALGMSIHREENLGVGEILESLRTFVKRCLKRLIRQLTIIRT